MYLCNLFLVPGLTGLKIFDNALQHDYTEDKHMQGNFLELKCIKYQGTFQVFVKILNNKSNIIF